MNPRLFARRRPARVTQLSGPKANRWTALTQIAPEPVRVQRPIMNRESFQRGEFRAKAAGFDQFREEWKAVIGIWTIKKRIGGAVDRGIAKKYAVYLGEQFIEEFRYLNGECGAKEWCYVTPALPEWRSAKLKLKGTRP